MGVAGSEKGKIMGGLPGFSAFGNPGVPFTETRNQREIPDGRKMANSLLPDPLTASFRARGDTELKESRRKTHRSGCSP